MPGAVATWVATAFLSFAPGLGITFAGIVGWAAYLGTTLVITGALAAVSKSMMPKPKTMRGLTTEYGGTVEGRRIIYGTTRVSGMNCIPPFSTGTEGAYLHQVLVLAGHPVEAIPYVYFDQDEIPDADIGAKSSTDSSGVVTNGTFNNIAWIRRYTGTQTSVDYILEQTGEVDSTFVGNNLTYLAIRYKFGDVYQKRGKPDVSALVQGKKVYDPRLDSTNGGSGSHRYTDSSTWEYSSNPALCLADYLMDADLGMGEDATRINWTTVAAAANICDETLTVPPIASPINTQSRFTCNIVLDATDRYEDNIEALCTCMLGHCYYTGGKWEIYAGAWSASAFDLTEDDIVGNVGIQTDTPRNQKYNAVRGQFYDASRNYQPSEFRPQTNSAYETADGERIWREVEFRGTTNEYEAQRKAAIILKRSRSRRTVTADFSMKAFKVKPFETGTLTLPEIGWTSQPVRCVSWEFRPEGSVRLSLAEENQTDWDAPDVTDYVEPTSPTQPEPGEYTPPKPLSLTATSVTGGTVLEWTVPPGTPTILKYNIYRHTASTPFSSSVFVTSVQATSAVIMLNAPQTYYYWVAGEFSGTEGSQYPDGAGVQGVYRWLDNPAAISTIGSVIGVQGTGHAGTPTVSLTGGALSVSVTPQDNYTSTTSGSNQLAGVVTATVSGGTPPYTYAWTDTSAYVTISSPTASSSNVLSTGTFTTRNVTITCTVTDSASPQAQSADSTFWSIEHT